MSSRVICACLLRHVGGDIPTTAIAAQVTGGFHEPRRPCRLANPSCGGIAREHHGVRRHTLSSPKYDGHFWAGLRSRTKLCAVCEVRTESCAVKGKRLIVGPRSQAQPCDEGFVVTRASRGSPSTDDRRVAIPVTMSNPSG